MKLNGQEIDGRAVRLDLTVKKSGGGGRSGKCLDVRHDNENKIVIKFN